MAGRNKAFLDVGGETILDRLLKRLRPFFEEILLVTRQPERYLTIPVRVVVDLYPARSSMIGIHAGLVHAMADFAFVVPCDAPFIRSAVIQLLLEEWSPQWDVVLPLLNDRYQPLCAIYSKRCLPVIEAQIESGDYRIYKLFDRMKVKTLSIDRIRAVDPHLISFFNVNTPSAYRVCRDLIGSVDDGNGA